MSGNSRGGLGTSYWLYQSQRTQEQSPAESLHESRYSGRGLSKNKMLDGVWDPPNWDKWRE